MFWVFEWWNEVIEFISTTHYLWELCFYKSDFLWFLKLLLCTWLPTSNDLGHGNSNRHTATSFSSSLLFQRVFELVILHPKKNQTLVLLKLWVFFCLLCNEHDKWWIKTQCLMFHQTWCLLLKHLPILIQICLQSKLSVCVVGVPKLHLQRNCVDLILWEKYKIFFNQFSHHKCIRFLSSVQQ